jgi:hypothetical protein
MAASIVEGRLEAADTKRQNKSIHQFSTLRFVTSDGAERTIKNAVATPQVARQLQAGTTGRFYLFNSADMRGVYAYRSPSGEVTAEFPRQNEKIGMVAIGVGLAAMVLYEVFGEGTPVLVLIALLLGGIGFFFARKSRSEVERLFAADNKVSPSPAG